LTGQSKNRLNRENFSHPCGLFAGRSVGFVRRMFDAARSHKHPSLLPRFDFVSARGQAL
jgi:hypothetical protein